MMVKSGGKRNRTFCDPERPERLPRGGFAVLLPVMFLALFGAGFLNAQQNGTAGLPHEELVYPPTSLCVLDVRGQEKCYPFQLDDFHLDLLAFLRSADYMTVRTESDVRGVLVLNRLEPSRDYDPARLARIASLAGCDYIASMSVVMSGQELMDGFRVPIFFQRNKVTHWVELDMALVEAETGSLRYSKRVRGEAGVGRGFQIYPVEKTPDLYLSFSEKDRLSRRTMRELARGTFEAIMHGIHKPLGTRYICYWQDEVHIIADKPGLCPICGSRLVRIKR